MRLATCEVKGETSESCALFWKIVNEMLREVTKKPDYKFNPKQFIVDEAAANFNGIQEVFGLTRRGYEDKKLQSLLPTEHAENVDEIYT